MVFERDEAFSGIIEDNDNIVKINALLISL